jgi:hypothetical protein
MTEETQPEEAVEEVTAEQEQEAIQKIYEQAKDAVYEEAAKHGLKREQVEAWKEEFGQLCAVPVGDKLYFVRPLTRKEWRDMTKMRAENPENPLTEIDIEEKVAIRTSVWPRIDEVQLRTVYPAGVPTALANAAMGLSGFNPAVQPIVL